MVREKICTNRDKLGGVDESQVSEIRETPIQAVKRHAESRKGKWFRAHQTRLCGSRWSDLIGQAECGLEELIGWEPRRHAGTNGPSKTSSTDTIEMATTHYVKDVNRAYVDVLLTNAICGNIVTASSTDFVVLLLTKSSQLPIRHKALLFLPARLPYFLWH